MDHQRNYFRKKYSIELKEKIGKEHNMPGKLKKKNALLTQEQQQIEFVLSN